MNDRRKGILVFAGKSVGRELIHYLLDENYPVTKLLWTSEEEEFLVDLASRGINVILYNEETQKLISESQDEYSWLVNLWSPYIINVGVLNKAERSLNVHPGLVPQCRGNDNATWTIRKGMTPGVSLIELTEELDAGRIYAHKIVDAPVYLTGSELNNLLKETAVQLFINKWPSIFNKKCVPQSQRGEGNVHKRSETNKDRCIDLDTKWSAGEFINWALAHDFSPGTTAEVILDGEHYKLRVSLEKINETVSCKEV